MNEPINKLRVPDSAAELIRSMHPDIKKKIKAALRNIISAPDTGKALKDDLVGLMSFRVGRFRIIYRRPGNNKLVEIVAVGPRKNIYEETYRLIKKEKKQ